MIASLELFEEAQLPRLRQKSDELTGYLEFLLEKRFAGQIRCITPQDARGAQLSLVVSADGINPRAVFDGLVDRNVTGDWREPDVIRVAPVPLYNSFMDVFEFAERLEDVFRELGA